MRFLPTLILIFGAAAPAAAQDMVGLSWTGDAYSISSGTGGGAFLGSTGYSQINCMARDGSGTLYAAAGDGVPASIITINLATGAATLIGSTGYFGVQGLTAANGALYAWELGSGS